MDEDTTIGCPQHGDFLCTPDEHLKGYGCPECRLKDIKDKIKDIVNRLDYCIEHESNASDNGFQINSDNYSNELHSTFVIQLSHRYETERKMSLQVLMLQSLWHSSLNVTQG